MLDGACRVVKELCSAKIVSMRSDLYIGASVGLSVLRGMYRYASSSASRSSGMEYERRVRTSGPGVRPSSSYAFVDIFLQAYLLFSVKEVDH